MPTCIVIDDEPHAIEGLRKYVAAMPDFELIASFDDPYQALQGLEEIAMVDLILLDIDMPRISGLELARSIRAKTRKLIFTTGHSKYAYEAFKVNADEYLLKPYTLAEFMLAVNKVFAGQNATRKNPEESFLVKNKDEGNRIVSVKFSEVIAVESKLNYVMIYTDEKKITTYMTLSEMLDILNQSSGFYQFHRSFIISYAHISFIEGNLIKMRNDLSIHVREFYRERFSEFLAKHLIKSKPKSKSGSNAEGN